jgi:hypothetical protein
MGDSESFLAYRTRAQTLQNMVNFNDHLFSDFALAEFVVSGLPDNLKAQANNFELLEKSPFVYGAFKSKLQQFYENLPKQTGGRAPRDRPVYILCAKLRTPTDERRDDLADSLVP